MKLKIRIFSIILIICTIVGTIVYSRSGQGIFEEHSLFSSNKTTVRVWYTDEALTPYLQSKAVAYNESRSKVRIEPVLVSGLEYLESINKASLEGDSFPDLYIITNDSLEKAYLAGLALEVDNGKSFLDSGAFPKAAINSVTYGGKYIAYPFYFETSSLVYNKTYLENMARESLENEALQAEVQQNEDAAQDGASTGSSEASEEVSEVQINDAQIAQRVQESLPGTVADILKFAQNYNAPDQVEAVFKWDVTDIFYNYFIVGNYMNVGGDAGDDVSKIDIYNTDTITCMKIYQQLNQFFAIDADDIDYERVTQDFIDGKIVFTVATTDILNRIATAKAEGNCNFDFGVANMPDLTSNYATRTMSVTDCIVVNGFSEHPDEANAFARFICDDQSGDIYKMSGKVAAHYGVMYGDNNLDTFVDVYANSVPMPKTIETSNLWMQLEIAFTKIWNGEECNSTLKQVSESIMTQVTGNDFTEEALPDPADEDIMAGLKEDED